MNLKKIADSIQEEQKTIKMIDYDLEKAVKILARIGKSIHGDFTIDKYNSELLVNLIKYQFYDPSCDFDLQKGLFLHGNIGVGKTISMMLFEKRVNNTIFPRRYNVVSCREAQMAFNREGYEGIFRYGHGSFSKNYHPQGEKINKSKPLIYCFDDLGTEDIHAKYFGQSTNVMSEIILDRYEMFQRHKMITHFTSNLTASDLVKIYGDRIVSRMKEMVNDVVLSGNDRRK
jgi:DNA replication protein DnaC